MVLTFYPTSRGSKECVRTECLLAWCSMFHSLKFDMQNDYFKKKVLVEGVFVGKIFAAMLLYALFPLI